jgi:predicted ferric reductase
MRESNKMTSNKPVYIIDRIVEGIAIIRKYESDPDVAAEHDVFYCGAVNADEMLATDRARMEVLGWRENEDSWSIFV